MDVINIIAIYTLVAISASLTSCITIYKPAISLLEEILDRKTVYSGILGYSLWIIVATIICPYNIIILLSNNNDAIIERFAVELSHRLDTDDE